MELSKPRISPSVTGDGAAPNGTAESGPLPSAETLMHRDAGRDADNHAGPSRLNRIAITIRLIVLKGVFITGHHEQVRNR